MPPRPITPQELRGVLAAIFRTGSQDMSEFGVNGYLQRTSEGVFNRVTGAEIRAVFSEMIPNALGRKQPFPVVTEYSFEYWYDYFFAELSQSADKCLYAGYVFNDDGSFRGEDSPPPGRTWKQIFRGMLDKGFRAFEVADRLSAAEALRLAGHIPGGDLQRNQVQVAFRGDGRSPDTVRSHHGSARQSKVDLLRAQRNMNKPWHPFNTLGHKVYYRRANTDNCLFTAVSITPNFLVATKFPLLDDLRNTNPAALGYAHVHVRPSRAAAAPRPAFAAAQRYLDVARNVNAATEPRRLRASKTNVYCVRLRDVYNTIGRQVADGGGDFPEFAATRISWTDHLLWFEVVRIHYDELNGNAGHLCVITDYRWLQDERLISDVLLDAAGFAKLRSFVDGVVGRGLLRAGRGGEPYVPLGGEPPFEIESITGVFEPR